MGPQRPRRRQGQKCSSSTTTSTTTKRTKITTDLLMTEESKWKAHYQQLQAYHEANGHSQVPSGTSTSENPDLYLWMMTQRRLYRDDCLSRERIDLLNQLQFAWNMPRVSSSSSSSSSTSSSNNSNNKNAKWQAMYRQFQRHQAKQQQQEQEHRRTQKMAGPLAKWVMEQQQNRDNMSPSHRDLLDQIGFPWNEEEETVMDQQADQANPRTATTTRTTTHQEEESANATFEDMFQELADFRDDHGHQCVPVDTPLGTWCRHLRMAYQKGQVLAQQRERLAGIDFIWDESKVQQERDEWNLYFDKLQAYQQQKGHTYVQREDDLPLWRWSERNDWMQRRGTLPKHRNDRLDSIGFWDPPPLDHSIERGEETTTTIEKENVVVNKKGNKRNKTKATSKAKGATTRHGTKRSNLKRKQKGGNRKSSTTRKSGNRDSLANDEEDDEAASNANATLRDNDGDDGDERQQPKNKGTVKSLGKRTPSTRSGAKQNLKQQQEEDDGAAQRQVRKSTRLSSNSTSEDSKQDDIEDEKPAAKRKRSNSPTTANTKSKRLQKEGDDNDEVEEPAKASRPKRTRKGPDVGAGNNQQVAGEQDQEEGEQKSSSRGRRESVGSTRRRTHVDNRGPHEQESKDDSVFRTPYQVGTKVMKRFGSHGWFSGEIISIYQENVFKIRYEDHDEETYQLPEEKASLDKIIANAIRHGIAASPVETKKVGTVDAAANEIFQVGTPVKTFFTGHGWFNGKIEMVKRNAIKVVYEDGDEETYEMPREKREMQEIVCNATKLCHAVGTAVKKHFKRHGWFKGQIVGMEEDRYKVQYEDGDKEDYLFETELQQLDQIVWNAKSQQ